MTISSLYWTYQMFREKVERDLDLEINSDEEAFISDAEFLGYTNDAIDQAEQMIITLYEDYFLMRAPVSFVADQAEYSLPDGIYAHKIRRFMYSQNSEIYTIKRVRDWKKFEELETNSYSNSSDLYRYFIVNEVAGQPKMLITPTPRTTGTFGKLWYIRQANRLTIDADICDIPESKNYIIAYLKVKCMEKEQNPMLQKAAADLQKEESLLQTTLAAMVPDADNEIEPDFSAYREHS